MSHLGAYWKVYVGYLKPRCLQVSEPRILGLRARDGLPGTTTGKMATRCGHSARDEEFSKNVFEVFWHKCRT